MWASQPGALRPLGAGERIDAAIKLVRANFLTLAKASLVIAVPSGIVLALVSITLTASSGSIVTTNSLGTPDLHSGRLFTLLGGVSVAVVITYLVTILVTAACFRIIGNAYLGQPSEWKEALRFGLSRIAAIIWVSLLVSLASLLPLGALGGTIVLLALAHAGGAGVAVGIVLGIPLTVAEIWFLTATRLAVPIVMLEDIRGVKAVRRSISLCRSHWWSVFGTQLLAVLLVEIAGAAVAVVLGLPLRAAHNTFATFVGDLLSSSISLAVFTPFSAAVLVVITIDLRVRKEGFDIELLASRMGVRPTPSAAGFIRPAAGWGYGVAPGTGGYPSGPGGYPPWPGGYPGTPGGGYPGGGHPGGPVAPGGYPVGPGPGYPGGPAAGGYPGPAAGGYPGPAAGGYPGPAAGGYPAPVANPPGPGQYPGEDGTPPGHDQPSPGWESTGWTPPPPPGYGVPAEQGPYSAPPPYGAPPAAPPPYGAPPAAPAPPGTVPGWPAPSPKRRPAPPRRPAAEQNPEDVADDEPGSPGSLPPPAGAE